MVPKHIGTPSLDWQMLNTSDPSLAAVPELLKTDLNWDADDTVTVMWYKGMQSKCWSRLQATPTDMSFKVGLSHYKIVQLRDNIWPNGPWAMLLTKMLIIMVTDYTLLVWYSRVWPLTISPMQEAIWGCTSRSTHTHTELKKDLEKLKCSILAIAAAVY